LSITIFRITTATDLKMFPRFALATSFLVVFTTTSVLSSLPLAVHAIDDTTTSFLSKQREEGVDNMVSTTMIMIMILPAW
jgi:hypothetical protein